MTHQLATVTNDTSMVDVSFDTYNSERFDDEIYDDSSPFTNDTDMIDEGKQTSCSTVMHYSIYLPFFVHTP